VDVIEADYGQRTNRFLLSSVVYGLWSAACFKKRGTWNNYRL